MNKRFVVFGVMSACTILGAYLNSLLASDQQSSNWKSLEKAYAQANVELAQARLAQAQSENKNVKGSVSQAMVAELEAGVQVSQERLKLLDSVGVNDPFTPQITSAEDAVRALEASHAESIKANQLQAGSVPDAEIRRETAEIAVAKAQVGVLKSVAQQPPDVRIQWQITELQDQIRALWARPLIED